MTGGGPYFPPADDDAPDAGRTAPTTVRFSHVTTGRYLPTPGKAPGWPFTDIGEWLIVVDDDTSSDWLRGLREWREEHLVRIGYDDAAYRRPELAWSQRNVVHVQAMVEDRYLFDPARGAWTVDRYLDDLDRRYGGVDSVLLWYVYPNIGIDDRNQIDLAHDLPGGLDGLRGAIDDFHRRGVHVFLPTKPWDQGTRPTGRRDWDAIAEVVRATGADGLNGDTYNGLPRAFYDACDALGCPVVLQPESTISAEEALIWNVQSWGKKVPPGLVPAVAKWKWLEPRHMINVENRWGRERTNDLQYCWFNGVGYNAWENVWGLWNGLTERDAGTLRRIATVYRHLPALIVARDWTPYVPTRRRGVFASRFPGDGLTLWTVVNRLESPVDGEQLAVRVAAEGTRYVDVWNGCALEPRRTDDGRDVLSFAIEPRGFGGVLAIASGVEAHGIDALLVRMAELAHTPLQSLSTAWRALPQTMTPIAPTASVTTAPDGMIAIPGADFDFVVDGIEIEGQLWDGVDVQYPWEPSPRRFHRHRLTIAPFHIDRGCVTNASFAAFVDATGYAPADAHRFLADWRDGRPRPGWDERPVTWVSLDDARAYAAWAGKRLPHEWEWQYAAQGHDGRRYPWGDAWDADAVPEPNCGRTVTPPSPSDAHPRGASPFGVLDLVGNVWQWTDEYADDHTRAAVLRGGSAYRPQTSHWYFPQAHRLDQHGKYLLMAPCKDRSACIGFRCVVDAA